MIDDRGPWIQTASGRQFFLLDPRAEDVEPFDVAHALSLTCRFAGHTREHYSVAQHSVLVGQLVPPELEVHALLHDAAEAYLGDITRPLKQALALLHPGAETSPYDAITERVDAAIAERFGMRALDAHEHDAIKRADIVALATERRDVVTRPLGNHAWSVLEGVSPAPTVILPLHPGAARERWLRRFMDLRRGVAPARAAATPTTEPRTCSLCGNAWEAEIGTAAYTCPVCLRSLP